MSDGPADAERLLIEFVRERDVQCPMCGYNIRDLTQAICPECREPLALAVDVRRLRLGAFLVTISPGIFSGICALLLLVPLVIGTIVSRPGPPPALFVIDGFGWASGIASLLLARKRHVFLRMRQADQIRWAVAAWGIHVAAFVAMIGYFWYFGG